MHPVLNKYIVPVITYIQNQPAPFPDLLGILSCFEGLMPLLPLLPVQSADWARMVPLYLPFVRLTDGRSVVVSGRWSPADIWTLELQTRGFHNHGEEPYQNLLQVERAY